MRTRIALVVSVVAIAAGTFGIAAAPAGADGTTICRGGKGLVHASPGVMDTAHAQKIVLAGALTGCTAGNGHVIFGANFARTGPVTCAQVQAGGLTVNGKVAVRWQPSQRSAGTISVTLNAGRTAHVTGTITSGFGAGTSFATDASVTPKFKSRGTPCTPSNKLQWAAFTLTSPLTIG